MSNRKFAVFGAGAVGGYFAAMLARAGFCVSVVARGQQLEAIRQSGLKVQSPKGDFIAVPEQATDDPATIGSVDAVILAVKAWQVEDAARAMRPLLSAATKVLPLQNGIEAAGQLEQILGRDHALIGLCRIICLVTAPGCIRHAGLEPTVVLGEPNRSSLSESAAALADALGKAGVVVQTGSDIYAALWEKLIFIAAVSGIGAASRATVGEVRTCPATRELLQKVMEEVRAVAKCGGVPVDENVVHRTLAFVDAMPANSTASMQRDIVEARPSEVEAILGAVVRLGEKAGVPTPVTKCVYATLLPQELRVRNERLKQKQKTGL